MIMVFPMAAIGVGTVHPLFYALLLLLSLIAYIAVSLRHCETTTKEEEAAPERWVKTRMILSVCLFFSHPPVWMLLVLGQFAMGTVFSEPDAEDLPLLEEGCGG
jgi:O-antigen/teichoic acid export membrane protein